MKELIDRLEKASGPDRVRDLAISVAINFKTVFDRECEWKWGAGGDEIEGHRGGRRRAVLDPRQFVPRWTESLDAAKALIPAGMFWSISHGRLSPDEPLGACTIRDPANVDVVIAESEAATVELAVCIAALKAREAGK